jgi:quinoprotein glucose dehydrogenase
MRHPFSATRAMVLGVLLAFSAFCLAESVAWPSYGGSSKSEKYAPLDQINADNVRNLRIKWRWESPDNGIVRAENTMPFAYKSTPIMIDDILYVSTSLGQVAAIDALTGQNIWVFDTGSRKIGRPANLGFNHRGVAYWKGGKQARILMPTNDAYLWSIDAYTGEPDPAFGDRGRIDLTLGLGREVDRRQYSVISAPMVINDVVIVGSSINDVPRNKEAPPGHVRGFSIVDGTQKWMFRTIPARGEYGAETWENAAFEYSGNTNVWTLMSADPELGYVYLPTGTPTNDWYGGHRLGDNLFAESLICVDANTGNRVWHFQMVHHGLWDYDLPAAPNLVDIMVDGKPRKAVAQISKQGFLYVLDRLTGEPIWPIVETPVPASTVPGERASPTQPIPSRPAAFDLQGISDATLIDFTPALHDAALALIKDYDYGPVFTPPSLRGTINLPGWGGGANWFGAAFDPETGVLYIPSTTAAIVVKLQPGDPARTNFAYMRSGRVNSVSGPEGLPLTKPPYARITAVDLNTGDHLWMVPNGSGDRVRAQLKELGVPDPGPVGAFGSTGPLLTRSLLFVGHAGEAPVLRVFDKKTGAVIHEIPLPERPGGTPMTYVSGDKQYISIAIGQGPTAGLVTLGL